MVTYHLQVERKIHSSVMMIQRSDYGTYLFYTPAIMDALFYHRCNGIALVVDVNNMKSLEDAKFKKHRIDSSNPRSTLPAILLATKCDWVELCKVTAEALAALAEEMHCFTYVEVSAPTGQNVL